jgi:hypothetical protein
VTPKQWPEDIREIRDEFEQGVADETASEI